MRTLKTDVAILGAGTAGLNARREVERAGKSWLLIDPGPYGTTCARTGCMPSKLLIAAGEAAHRARRASLFGVNIAPEAIRVDRAAVMERVRRERDRFVELTARGIEAHPEEHRIRGRARFLGPSTLAVDSDPHLRIEARAVVIATGSVPVIPRELEPLGPSLLTTETVFELESLPDSIAVFGTGAIGLELGQALHQLGVRVAFYNPFDQLGPFTDPRIAESVRDLFAAELDLSLGQPITDARIESGCAVIRHRDASGQRERRFSRVLVAAGRRPQVDGLALDKAGIELDARGIPTFRRETMQCGSAPIFMAGDVDGDRTIMHEAVEDGIIAGANAASFPEVTARERKTPLNIAFTSPQLAMFGQTFKQACECDHVVGESSYEDQGRARVMGQNRGMVRLYAERASQRLIGGEMFGPGVEHTAHLLAWAVQQRLSVRELLSMPVYHPTLEEGIRTALRRLARELAIQGVGVVQSNADCPGA